jgi:hypothetical protein
MVISKVKKLTRRFKDDNYTTVLLELTDDDSRTLLEMMKSAAN